MISKTVQLGEKMMLDNVSPSSGLKRVLSKAFAKRKDISFSPLQLRHMCGRAVVSGGVLVSS